MKFKVRVKSLLYDYYNDTVYFMVPDDTYAWDLIQNVCSYLGTPSDTKMFLRLEEDGTQIDGSELLSEYYKRSRRSNNSVNSVNNNEDNDDRVQGQDAQGLKLLLDSSAIHWSLWLTTLFFLLVGIIFVSTSAVFWQQMAVKETYNLVIDAGTFATIFNIYYLTSSNQPAAPVSVYTCIAEEDKYLPSNMYGGGLVKFQDHPYYAELYIFDCIQRAEAYLLRELKVRPGKVEAFLGATEAMRALNATDKEVAEKIMFNAMSTVSTSMFLYNDGNTMILDGETEAVYTWISTNIVMGSLPGYMEDSTNYTSINNMGSLDIGADSAEIAYQIPDLVGSLDMGINSAQIAFPCNDDSEFIIPGMEGDLISHKRLLNAWCGEIRSDSNIMHLDLYSKHHRLLTHSASCYGHITAAKRFTALLVFQNYLENNNTTITKELINPCLPSEGVSPTQSFPTSPKNIFDDACTMGISDKGFLEQVKCLLHKDDFSFVHKSAANTNICSSFIDILLVKEQCQQIFTTCLNYPVTQQLSEMALDTKTQKYVALSAYHEDFFRLVAEPTEDTVSFDQVVHHISVICNGSRSEITGKQFDAVDCFKTNYFFKFLVQGYNGQFNKDNFESIHFKAISPGNKTSLTWSMGFVANKTHEVLLEPGSEQRISKAGFITMQVIGVIMLILSIIVMVRLCVC